MTSEMKVDPGAATVGERPGPAFAQALAVRDFDKLRSLLDPDIEFRALTPRRTWEASGDAETLALFRRWFDLPTVVEEIDDVSSHAVGDRMHVAYRFLGHGDDGPFVIEQQIYYTERDGRIDWMRMMCSGFRPR
jgi:ketosteroid isomerase-like protein